jgi:biotin carboxyl carrier protein
MLRKFRVNVDGRIYIIAVEELSVGGVAAPVTVSAPVAALPIAAPAIASAPPPSPASASSSAKASTQEIAAPLAGVIDSIEVRVGQTIKTGDKLFVLEAMKMKTDVLAKVDGTVQHIAVKAHESVETGQVVMTIG